MTEYEKMIASQPYNCIAPELETIYGQWFEMDPTAVKEEWCRLSGRKLG